MNINVLYEFVINIIAKGIGNVEVKSLRGIRKIEVAN